ncbi:MAG: polysaccharide pyruvyl transferase CsaB [Armatimonadaceae bacterium]
MGSLQVAALGYYGFGNLGDEAVLGGILRSLRSEPRFADARFRILSNDGAETRRLHPGVETANRWKWREAATALRGTDLFILGGGSLLQDATSARSVVWYTLMALIARRRARRVLWWGQGIGPLNSGVSRKLVRLIADQADARTVRDNSSAELLKAIGVSGSIQVVADPAFALEPTTEPTANPKANHSLPASPKYLLALREWQHGSVVQTLQRRELFSGWGWRHDTIAGLPMHLPHDREYMAGLLGADFVQQDWRAAGWTIEQVLGWVGGAEQVVAMRLHALIFAARCAVPFVALSYDPKVDALAQAAGQEDALLSVNEVTPESLGETLRHVRDTQDKRRAQLRDFGAQQRERARQPAEIAAQLM